MRVKDRKKDDRQILKEEKMNRFRNCIFLKMYRAAAILYKTSLIPTVTITAIVIFTITTTATAISTLTATATSTTTATATARAW